MLRRSASPTRGSKVITAPFPLRASTAQKKPQAMTLERQVAAPAPSTSSPSGSRTNMKSGSSAMFSSPPSTMPKPAADERPMLRSRFDSTFESTVGTPPATMTQSAYCLANSKVFSPAPSSASMGRMKTPMAREKSAAMARPRYMENVPTRRASSSLPCPSRRETSEPPPTPASPARQVLILNTGSMSEVAATM